MNRMSDLISRKKAMSHPFANGQYDHENANKHFIMGFESYKEWLSDLPSAVKTGRWYIDAEGNVRCTACKTKCLRDDVGINILSSYCPNCGAKVG